MIFAWKKQNSMCLASKTVGGKTSPHFVVFTPSFFLSPPIFLFAPKIQFRRADLGLGRRGTASQNQKALRAHATSKHKTYYSCRSRLPLCEELNPKESVSESTVLQLEAVVTARLSTNIFYQGNPKPT